jgi:hypothetical protein
MNLKLKHILAETQCENCRRLFKDCGHISEKGAFFYRGTVKVFTQAELLNGKCNAMANWGKPELDIYSDRFTKYY